MAGKEEEPQAHPSKDQLPNVSYCISSPPPWWLHAIFFGTLLSVSNSMTHSLLMKRIMACVFVLGNGAAEAFLLGFQHFIVMLGTSVFIPTVLVPQMGGQNEEKARVIQTLLFVSGINTLLQSLFGTRLPAVMGGSYTFLPTTTSIVMATRFNDTSDPIERFGKIMRAIQGSLIVASSLQIVLGFCSIWRHATRFLTPLSAVPLTTLVGFGLYELGFPGVARCIEIGLPELVILVFISQYLPHLISSGNHLLERFSVVLSVAIAWLYAYILAMGGAYNNAAARTRSSCRIDHSGLIDASPWIRVPYPFQWGTPSFDAGEAFAMMMASFVSLIESTGTMIVVSRYASASPVPPSILSRGAGWQGVGILISGLFGTVTSSSMSVENVGLVALTRVGSRRAVMISAGFMIFFSILGKFGAVFASIPAPISAALYCVFFAYVGSGGLSFLQFCNLNSFRVKFIVGFSMFIGLSLPRYFKDYRAINGNGPVNMGARWFNDMVYVPLSSGAFVAGCTAYFLDNTIFKKGDAIRKDRGKHWWDKFRSFKGDSRSEEFYSLPFNLNRYFPSA